MIRGCQPPTPLAGRPVEASLDPPDPIGIFSFSERNSLKNFDFEYKLCLYYAAATRGQFRDDAALARPSRFAFAFSPFPWNHPTHPN